MSRQYYRRSKIKRTEYSEVLNFINTLQQAMVLYANKKYHSKVDPLTIISLARHKTVSKYIHWKAVIEYNIRYMLCYYRQRDTDRTHSFIEYKHIQNDPVIGSIDGNWKTVLGTLIAHEYAHALDFNVDPWPYLTKPTGFVAYNPKTQREKRGHGESWQLIYRDLRENFINNNKAQEY
jgi:hypothetical protein